MSSLTHVFIALGSNIGDRAGHLAWAVDQLHAVLVDLRLSRIIESEAVEVADVQPPYLNAVASGYTSLSPTNLLDRLLSLEHQRGRVRAGERAARTLDLDLVLYGDLVIDEPGLVVPHPRFRSRAFVLEPLVELAPDYRDPVTGLALQRLLEELRGV